MLKLKKGDNMYTTNDSIKFMIAKIFFNLAEFKYNEIDKQTPTQFHGIKTMQLFYIEKGEGKFIVDDNDYQYTDNSYFVIPPLMKYSLCPTKESSIYSVYFILDTSTGYQRYFYLLEKLLYGNRNLSIFFHTLIDEFKTKSIGYNEIVVSMFKSIIINIIRNENVEGPRLSHWDLDSLQYNIEKIFKEEFNSITLKEMADRLFISERELQRYLEKNYGKNFTSLKNDSRMSYALNLLINTDLSVSNISEIVGYSSNEHFSVAFKNYYGKSPLKYKKEKKSIKH